MTWRTDKCPKKAGVPYLLRLEVLLPESGRFTYPVIAEWREEGKEGFWAEWLRGEFHGLPIRNAERLTGWMEIPQF